MEPQKEPRRTTEADHSDFVTLGRVGVSRSLMLNAAIVTFGREGVSKWLMSNAGMAPS